MLVLGVRGSLPSPLPRQPLTPLLFLLSLSMVSYLYSLQRVLYCEEKIQCKYNKFCVLLVKSRNTRPPTEYGSLRPVRILNFDRLAHRRPFIALCTRGLLLGFGNSSISALYLENGYQELSFNLNFWLQYWCQYEILILQYILSAESQLAVTAADRSSRATPFLFLFALFAPTLGFSTSR